MEEGVSDSSDHEDATVAFSAPVVAEGGSSPLLVAQATVTVQEPPRPVSDPSPPALVASNGARPLQPAVQPEPPVLVLPLSNPDEPPASSSPSERPSAWHSIGTGEMSPRLSSVPMEDMVEDVLHMASVFGFADWQAELNDLSEVTSACFTGVSMVAARHDSRSGHKVWWVCSL
jgi:hypothetical protein